MIVNLINLSYLGGWLVCNYKNDMFSLKTARCLFVVAVVVFFNILRQQLNCTKNKEHEVASNISGQNKAVKRQ